MRTTLLALAVLAFLAPRARAETIAADTIAGLKAPCRHEVNRNVTQLGHISLGSGATFAEGSAHNPRCSLAESHFVFDNCGNFLKTGCIHERCGFHEPCPPPPPPPSVPEPTGLLAFGLLAFAAIRRKLA